MKKFLKRIYSKFKKKSGLYFECSRCGACCMKKGSIFFISQEISAAAKCLGMRTHEFRKKFIITTIDGVYEIYTPDACPLLDSSSKCTIYKARPAQCRTFPFWNSILHSPKNYRTVRKECPGIGRGRYLTKNQYAGSLVDETKRF